MEHNIPQSAWEMLLQILHMMIVQQMPQVFSTIQNQDITEDTTHEESHDNTRNTTDTLCMLYEKAAKGKI